MKEQPRLEKTATMSAPALQRSYLFASAPQETPTENAKYPQAPEKNETQQGRQVFSHSLRASLSLLKNQKATYFPRLLYYLTSEVLILFTNG